MILVSEAGCLGRSAFVSCRVLPVLASTTIEAKPSRQPASESESESSTTRWRPRASTAKLLRRSASIAITTIANAFREIRGAPLRERNINTRP